MKRFISIFLTLCMVLACMLTVVACNNNNNNDSSSMGGLKSVAGEDPTDSQNSQQGNNSANSGSNNVAGSVTTSSSTKVSVPTSSHNTWDSIKSTDRPKHEWQPATDLVLGTNDGTQNTTVFLVGDSTVCYYDNETAKYYPRNGYGMWFDDFLNDKVTINNLAISGRSSRSFITENNYKTLTSEIKAGDYLVIGFGHNDQKADNRYTNPNSQVTDDDSLKYYLYKYYIKVAIDAGATPILCTPIVRQSPNGTYTGDRIHVTKGSGDNCLEGGDYVKAIVELGQEFGITVINLTTVTKQIMETAGAKGSEIYYASEIGGYDHSKIDKTHVNAYGAAVVAYNFMLEIQKTENTLKNYVDSAKMVEPTKDVLVPNINKNTSKNYSSAEA